MIANYGFKDGSGDWYVAFDTDKCNGCVSVRRSVQQKSLNWGRMRLTSSAQNRWPL